MTTTIIIEKRFWNSKNYLSNECGFDAYDRYKKTFWCSILIYLQCYFLIYDIEVAFSISLGISI